MLLSSSWIVVVVGDEILGPGSDGVVVLFWRTG